MFFRFPRMTFGFMSTTHCLTLSKEGSPRVYLYLNLWNGFKKLEHLFFGFVNSERLFAGCSIDS